MLADRTYEDLLETDFLTRTRQTGRKVYFSILVGYPRAIKEGVPVPNSRYQPNWWFQSF